MLYRTLATVVAVTLALAPTADAKPRHKHKTQLVRIECTTYKGCQEVKTTRDGRDTSTVSVSAKRHVQTDSNGNTTYLIQKARGYLGMTAGQIGLKRRTLWCGEFMSYIMGPSPRVKNPNMAKDYLGLPRTTAQVGAIAVFSRRGGGHVGIVTGFEGRYPIIISGNSTGHRVYEGLYPRTPIAYVSPI